MTNKQKIVILTGSFGIVLNVIAISLGIRDLGYVAMFLGRLAALLYMIELDRLRYYYVLPLTISLLNVYYSTEYLIFLELLLSSIIYQVSAFNTFNKLNKTNL